MMGYFITNISFNLLVIEFLKSVNIWQSYRQNGDCVILPIRLRHLSSEMHKITGEVK